jgi:transcriptional regulator with XRE-family HTH domain
MSDSAAAIASRADELVADHVRLLEDLVYLRAKRGLTVEEVAERMSVSPETVEAMEAYNGNPTLARVRRYALAVGGVLSTEVIDAFERDEQRAEAHARKLTMYIPVKFADFVQRGSHNYREDQDELLNVLTLGRHK